MQTIDTAPRNGRKILGYNLDTLGCDEGSEGFYYVCFWMDFHPDSGSGRNYLLGDGRRGCFYYEYSSKVDASLHEAKPTHWEPVPAEPIQTD